MTGRALTTLLALGLVAGSAVAAPVSKAEAGAAGRAPAAASPDARARAIESYGRLPLRFEANAGQSDASVRYAARGDGYGFFLTDDGPVLRLAREGGSGATVRMRLEGAAASRPAGEERLPGATSYFVGDASTWRADVPGFARVRYPEVYPGVDAVYYGNGGALEYDFEVAPGADPSAVRVRFDGAERVAVDARSGDLVLGVAGGGEVRQHAPVAYQLGRDGAREIVAAGYAVGERGDVRFRLGAYDASRALVIDPVLNYSTYLGGGAADRAFAVAVDGAGSAYVTGFTRSVDFPASGGYQQQNGGGADVFVTKLSPAGSAIVYSTYVGGSGDDQAFGIVLDAVANAYVTGTTASPNFPTTAFGINTRGGGTDAFVIKLNTNGNLLAFSDIFGGSGDDTPNAIARGASDGGLYITGTTASTDYPTLNPIQIDSGEANDDAFVTKVNATGTALVYSTYLGGSDRDSGTGIAVDAAGDAIVVGFTGSANFPTRAAFQLSSAGNRDAFVASLNPTGTMLNFSTYFGGGGSDTALSVALDASANIYVTGETFSNNFPTQNALQVNAGGGDVFLTKFNPTATTLVYSTYLGGNDNDQGEAVAVDGSGAAYVAGFTKSTDFPTTLPLQTDPGDANFDAFLVRVNQTGSRVSYSTYLGGNGDDRARGLAVDGSGNAYLVGETASTNFPTQNGVSTDKGGDDAFAAKISGAIVDVSVTLEAAPDPVRQNGQITYTATVTNTSTDAAGDVTLTFATPAGTTFASTTQSQGTCTTPAVGAAGTITCSLGTIDANQSATVTIVLDVTAAPGSTIDATATVTTTATDTNAVNNTDTASTGVIAPVDPPVITSIQSLIVTGKPYRIQINGSNFQPGVQVFIGDDAVPWPSVKYKSTTALVLKKDQPLKAKFPKGVPVTVRVVNPDGGEASATFTR